MSKHVIVVHHCLLNPTIRAEGADLDQDVVSRTIEYTKKHHVIQLPCPELIFAGYPRPAKVKDDYDCSEFRELCKKLAEELKIKITTLEKQGKKLKEIVGLGSSPSCGVKRVHTRKGKVPGSGILVEEIKKVFPEARYRTHIDCFTSCHQQ